MVATSDPDSLDVEMYLNIGLCKLEPVIVSAYNLVKQESNSSLNDSFQSDSSV